MTRRRTRGAISARSPELELPRFPIAAALTLVACIGAIGFLHIRSEQRRVREQVEAQLAAITDAKAAQIVTWRKERLADAAVGRDAHLVRLLQERARRAAPSAVAAELRPFLDALARSSGYRDVVVCDLRGEAVLAVGTGNTISPAHAARHLWEASRAGGAVVTELERDERTGLAHVDVVAPIFEPRTRRLLGGLLLRLDPNDFLNPLIQSWPTPSASAETLLVRRDGDSVLFLNELRHRAETALSLRLNLDDALRPAVRVALGERGVVRGVDYRGANVLATGRAIEGSSWFLVAQVDADEALGPARAQALTLGVVVLLLVGSGLGSLALWWHRERSKAEQRVIDALRASDDMLRYLYDAVVGLDADLVVTTWNGAAERLFGITAAEAMGQVFTEIVPSDYRGYTQAAFMEALHERGQLQFEVRRRLPSGVWVDVEASAVVLRDGGGRIEGYVSVNRDVTKRKAAEEALRASEERLARILETFDDMIWIQDVEGRLEYVNTRGAEFLGDAAGEMLGRYIHDFIPEHLREPARADTAAIARGESVRREFVTRNAAGAELWHQLSRSPLRDADGRVVGSVAVFVDVTEQHRAREQLLQAQKMDAVGRLASGIAHDFNNLLAVILSCSDFLLEELEAEDPRTSDVQDIREAGARGAKLVSQLLAFSRKSAFRSAEVDLNRVVEGMDALIHRSLGAGISTSISLAPAPWKTRIDPGQLEQVLMNLAVNARDAMAGVGELRIETRNESLVRPPAGCATLAPGRYVVLAVADTGCGMAPDVLSKLFEPFFTTKEKGKGTGLGLSTVYGIVEGAGGRIAVDSAPALGTTFTIYLPACGDLDERARTGTDRPRGAGETVLLVDDEEPVRRAVRRMLEESGFSVVEAGSAEEALRSMSDGAGRVEIVLSDVMMPGTSGTELADALRTARPELPIVLMTGCARSAGARPEPVIEKPFSSDVIAASLVEALRSRGAGARTVRARARG